MRDDEMRRFRGLTWMGWANYLFLRWTGFRLIRYEKDGNINEIGLRRYPDRRWP